MDTARVQIGRVRMKAGGAEVRVLRQPSADNGARDRIRAWTSEVLHGRAPDAVVMVAWWSEGDGCPSVAVSAGTYHEAFTVKLLAPLAAEEVRNYFQAYWNEQRIMRTLGYVQPEPDPAS